MTATAIVLTVLLGYAVGTLLGARIALRYPMSRITCTGDSGRTSPCAYLTNCRDFHKPGCAKPVGAVRERHLGDAAKALGMGLGWPVLLAATAVMRTAPLTEAESRRRLAEQERRIAELSESNARLMRQIDAGR